MNRKVRNDRLAKLIVLMKKTKKFFPNLGWNMSSWFEPEFQDDTNPQCKTAACALGTACLDPSFRKAGLKLESVDLAFYPDHVRPVYKNKTHSEAGAEFFGLSPAEAEWLFDPTTYRNADGDQRRNIPKEEVLRRIEVVAKHYKKKTAPMIEGTFFDRYDHKELARF